MQDAVILANCIYDLEDVRPESLTAAFKSYKQQRFSEAKKQITNSKVNAKISSGQVPFFSAIDHITSVSLISISLTSETNKLISLSHRSPLVYFVFFILPPCRRRWIGQYAT